MGSGGEISDVNLRTLPCLNEYINNKFNFDSLEYLFTRVRKEVKSGKINNPPKNILITFGGSDPDNLTLTLLNSIKRKIFNITVIAGPYFNYHSESENCRIIQDVWDIEKYLKESDLVITSFGMTFIESLILNRPVLVINPTEYHDRLTIDFGYPYLIKRDYKHDFHLELMDKFNEIIDKMMIENAFGKNVDSSKLARFYSLDIGVKINELAKFIKKCEIVFPICPNCSMKSDKILFRTKEWNMHRCTKCGLIFLNSFNEPNFDVYGKKYFVSEYKSKYGKTYEEDKENIVKFGENRLNIIKTYVDSGNLLDFGFRFGFFLGIMREKRFHYNIDR